MPGSSLTVARLTTLSRGGVIVVLYQRWGPLPLVEMINSEFNRSHLSDRSSLAATQRDRVCWDPARLTISAKERNAALTAAAFANRSAAFGAMTTTLELVRSRSVYFPRTNAPKSERLYSERSS